jgi:hypothetical protein
MGEFYLEKYPVISENGDEYLVSVFQSIAYKHVQAEIHVKRKGLFGRKKFERVNWSLYEEPEWKYDYRAIAMNEVKKYENRIERQRQHEINQKQGAKRFEEWDGRASE